MGHKSRRRGSLMYTPEGDYLQLGANAAVLKQLAKDNEGTVCFADYVDKINKKMKTQQRILFVTDSFVYNLKPDAKNPKPLRKPVG